MRFHRSPAMYLSLCSLLACSVPIERFGRADASPEDGPVACDPPGERCGGACVDVAESSTSCGRCGHDCGGGACASGVCQPVLVAGAELLDEPKALAVSSTGVFWTERTRVRSCPLPSGCTTDPRLIADAYSMANAIGVTDDAVYFTGCRACLGQHELRRCPVSGCPEPAPFVTTTSVGYEEILIGETRAFWREGTEALVGCAHADCAGTATRQPAVDDFGGELAGVALDGPTLYVKPAGVGIVAALRSCPEAGCLGLPRIVTNSSNIGTPFRVHAERAYWPEGSSPNRVVRTCALANCGDTTTTFAADDPPSTELEVDPTGVYWSSGAGTIRHCPLTGCPPGGPTTLASGRASPRELTLGAGFVYWIEGDAIWKLAKP